MCIIVLCAMRVFLEVQVARLNKAILVPEPRSSNPSRRTTLPPAPITHAKIHHRPKHQAIRELVASVPTNPFALVEATTRFGRSPLHVACIAGKDDAVRVLLDLRTGGDHAGRTVPEGPAVLDGLGMSGLQGSDVQLVGEQQHGRLECFFCPKQFRSPCCLGSQT